MPVQDPFGPTVYMPNPTNTGPGSASQGWAEGITNLGRALFPDPNAVADARLKGAQLQDAQAATQSRSALGTLFSNPSAMADPRNQTAAYGYIAKLPAAEQEAWFHNLSGVMQATGLPQATIDQWNAGSGRVPAGNTPSGFNADLANRQSIANTQAGATIGAATIGANASIANTNTTTGAENWRWYNTPANTTSAGEQGQPPAGPAVVPQGRVTGAAPPPGSGPPAGGGYMPHYEAPSNTAVVLSGRGAQQGQPGSVVTSNQNPPPPSHGSPPPPQQTQPQNGPQVTAPPADANGNPQPGANAAPATTAAGNLTTAVNRQPTNLQKGDTGAEIESQTATMFGQPGVFGTNPVTPEQLKPGAANPANPFVLSPPLRAAVENRASWYMTHPGSPTVGNSSASVARAMNDIIAPLKAANKLTTVAHRAGRPDEWFTGGGAPSVELNQGETIPPEMLQNPPAPQPQGNQPSPTPLPPSNPQPPQQPAPTPLPPTGRRAIAAPPPQPQQTAGGPKPPVVIQGPRGRSSAPAAAPQPGRTPIQPGFVWQNRTFKGGDANDRNNWVPATPADIATAKRGGQYIP